MGRGDPPNRDPQDHRQPKSENNQLQLPRRFQHKVTKNMEQISPQRHKGHEGLNAKVL